MYRAPCYDDMGVINPPENNPMYPIDSFYKNNWNCVLPDPCSTTLVPETGGGDGGVGMAALEKRQLSVIDNLKMLIERAESAIVKLGGEVPSAGAGTAAAGEAPRPKKVQTDRSHAVVATAAAAAVHCHCRRCNPRTSFASPSTPHPYTRRTSARLHSSPPLPVPADHFFHFFLFVSILRGVRIYQSLQRQAHAGGLHLSVELRVWQRSPSPRPPSPGAV